MTITKTIFILCVLTLLLMSMIHAFNCCIHPRIYYIMLITPSTEFPDKLPNALSNDYVVILNQSGRKNNTSYPANTFEFEISNPNLTFKEIEKIVEQIVPQNAQLKYIT